MVPHLNDGLDVGVGLETVVRDGIAAVRLRNPEAALPAPYRFDTAADETRDLTDGVEVQERSTIGHNCFQSGAS